jgi:hypothetical protein
VQLLVAHLSGTFPVPIVNHATQGKASQLVCVPSVDVAERVISHPTRAAAIVHTKFWLQERVTQYRDAHYGLHIGTSKTVYAGSSDLAAVYAWTKCEWATWAEIRVQICTGSNSAQVSFLLAHT